MVKVKKAPALAAAPQLAEPAPEHTYGWNVMSTCTNPTVVLEHKSKHDYLTLEVARTPENYWVGGYLCRTAMGTLGSSAVSLKGARFVTFQGAAQWAAGQILSLPKAQEKLSPNVVRKLESLVGLQKEAELVPVEQPADLPWLDCDGTVLLEGDKATVLPDVSKRLSGKLVQVLGDYDAQKKSVQVEPVGWEGEPFGILLCFLKRLPVLGENLEEPFDYAALPHKEDVRAEQDAAAATGLAAHQASVGRITSGITSVGSPSPELVAKVKRAGRKQSPVAPLVQAGTAAHEAAQPTTPAPKPSTFDALQDGVVSYKAGLRVLPLSSIVVTRNTRKVFEEAALAELASSIQAHGVLQPIVVRPAAEAGQYELVAGERRYRAALAAGLTEIPATVRTLTDREFLEVQLLENLQRVDVRPADEAQAFAELLKHGFPLEEIAAKVGKPARFVAERARLMELLPEWVDALQQGRLLIGSAQQLARLTRSQQAEAHQHLDSTYGDKVDVAGTMRRVYSAADIRQHLDRQFKTHDLEQAAFPKDDAALYPAAGACVTCPKRTGNTPYLFDEMGGNTCLDGACFAEKSARFVARMAVQLGQDGQPVLKVADHWGRVPTDVLNLNKHKSTERLSEAELTQLREAGRVRPALMTEGARAGQIVEVVLDAAVASQPDVVTAIKQQRQAETDKEKEAAAKVRALGAARRQAYYQLTADVHGQGLYTAVLLRRMLYKKLEYHSYGSLRELLRKVYGWEDFKGGSYLDEKERKRVVSYLAAMEVPQLQGLMLDMQLLSWLEEEHPSTLPALCKELGWSDEELLAAHAERKKGKKQEASA